MNKKESIQTFVSVMKDFLEDVYSCYPETSLFLLQKFVNGMAITNPSYIVDTFVENVEPYKKHILEKNEDFFINNKDKFKDENKQFASYIEKIINIWKEPSTPVKTKDCIWRYMTILMKLSDTC